MSRRNSRAGKAARRAERDARQAARENRQASALDADTERLLELLGPYSGPGVSIADALGRMRETGDPGTAEAMEIIARSEADGWLNIQQASPAEGPLLLAFRARRSERRR